MRQRQQGRSLYALESLLTTSGNEDVRKTVGRFYLQVVAEARLNTDRGIEYELFFELKDIDTTGTRPDLTTTATASSTVNSIHTTPGLMRW